MSRSYSMNSSNGRFYAVYSKAARGSVLGFCGRGAIVGTQTSQIP
jgi:hypothetical protein